MKIFDCITFYNANLLFNLRFNILKDIVDYFVICEANKDHTGNLKPYNFDPKIPKEYEKKIIYIKVSDLPSIKLKGKNDYKILKIQMENLFRGIKTADENDLIIFSDEDEIPNPESIGKFQRDKFKFGIFLQNMYYYKFNIMNTTEGNGNWPGSRLCLKKNLKSFFKFRLLKIKNLEYPFWRIDKERNFELIKDGGWHFTYLMKPKEIRKKIESMAHTEFNKEKYKDEKTISENIKNLKDPFGRNFKLKKTDIDDTYPEYLRNNLNLYSDWILE